MAYKKYIKRGGKVYGPYIYHSRRVDGKVVSEYHGSTKKNYGKFFLIGAAFLLVVSLFYFLSSGNDITGRAVLDLNADYNEGQVLQGNVKLSIREGEFIPADSEIVFNNNGNLLEYKLSEFVFEEPVETEAGFGFGVPGNKEIFPVVDFILVVESEIEGSNNTNTVRLNEISAKASAEEPFVYALEEGEIGIELKPKSVQVNGTELPDSTVRLTNNRSETIVTTAYKEMEQGFGESYLGEISKELEINVSALGLVLQPGNLKISIVNQKTGSEIVSLTTTLGSVSEDETITPSTTAKTPQTPEINKTNVTETNLTISQSELTAQERAVLIETFGDVSVKAIEAKEKNDFIIVRYELGSYWVEYSYSSSFGNETLEQIMEADRIKWLKDIAASLSQSESSETQRDDLEGNYTV